MSQIEEFLNDTKKLIEKGKGLLNKAEARIEETEKQLDGFEQEVMEMGFDPKNLNGAIEELTVQEEKLVASIKALRTELPVM